MCDRKAFAMGMRHFVQPDIEGKRLMRPEQSTRRATLAVRDFVTTAGP
jgi:hypothetical protein